jgi:nicotinamidase-related amidase
MTVRSGRNRSKDRAWPADNAVRRGEAAARLPSWSTGPPLEIQRMLFSHRNPAMQLKKPRTALVLADIQNEFLEEKPQGTYYALISDSLKKRDVIPNLERLLKTAQELGYYIIHSPHWFYPTDLQWESRPGAIAHYLGTIGFCGRKDPVDLEGFHGSRADYYEPFKKYLMDGHTCTTSPHKVFGPDSNDMIKQLQMRKIEQVIMAGPASRSPWSVTPSPEA